MKYWAWWITSWNHDYWEKYKKPQYSDNSTLMAEGHKKVKSLRKKVKEKSEKAGWNSTFKKLRSWHLVPSLHGKWKREKWKQWQIFLGSEITVDGDCSHDIKRCLLLGRKAMTNLEDILKNRDITLLTKVHIVNALFFPVVMYIWESWIIKKAECQKLDAFELWSWRRLLRVPWQQGDQASQS